MSYRFLIAVCLLIISSRATTSAQAQSNLQTELTQWQQQDLMQHSTVGFYAIDAETGKVLAQSNPQLSITPASTQKLITTSTALELLGAGYRFKTTLTYSGKLENDTLFGDIVLIAGGDPALGSKYFKDYTPYQNFVAKWAEAISNLNIKAVTGNIFIDLSTYDDQSIPNTWIWEDMGNYYGAGVFALSAYDNTYEIHFSSPARANEQTKIEYTSPVLPKVDFDNQVISSDDNWDNAYVFGSPLDSRRVLRGSIPKNRRDFKVKASIPNPPMLVGEQLMLELALSEIQFNGRILTGTYDFKVKPDTISTIESPRLAKIIDVTNHESVNLFAEHCLKQIAYETTGKGTTKAGLEAVSEFWESKGMDTKSLFLEDGSGLSRFNALTPQQMVFVLNYMKHSSINSEAFYNSLPTPPNGTLWYLNEANFPQNSLYVKSGSMTRVRSFAGQLTTKEGKNILFCIILNNFDCSQMQAVKAIEKLLVKMRAWNY
ncbi:D-alanyl-D-alanine carboxypeptidase/D-alanyl-D-alanine-endopeptidase (penicillin-binding protein 4) [Mangrovibacterium marinum]|uniref:D-alanyl-D-alanine carboxypeptidase/D-alanyl-D-alanine-endopeptidase (Penicillin-binding protein 4) n=1 Tax=Mangrovibacterium marinum TaxID=1639118 RepID=A0A2T5BZ68_9BACT|nr:D-alanyl-D-alanine carboxypeptidase/D-alanyl-D-alanine-endopeptidase [Mangrovibacterium marinum]PTN07563.1 D-alanyl-D-alanine carboxypeptidase/D-alanyl-D-alanine-endopeptidase (penicillin-binding protein 4) [Mangrovibacterium marinum]